MSKQNKETDESEKGFFDKAENIKKMLWVFYIICALLVLVDFIYHRHVHELNPLEGFYAFYPIYGFVACVVLVLIAKQMRKVLMRDEDYYEQNKHNKHNNKKENNSLETD